LDEVNFYEPSFTDGSVSAQKVMKDSSRVIQVSAPTRPGNSGGPVINELGEVIGIVTFGSANYENYTFIIPSNTIKSFMQQVGIAHKQGQKKVKVISQN
jgi:serine protease Do